MNSEMVSKPWGSYQVLYGDDYDIFKIKKLTVNPNSKLSLQSHEYRKEVWICYKGNGLAQIDDDFLELKSSNNTIGIINNNQKHRLINNTDDILEVIEIQIGVSIAEDINSTYLGEDDIIRYEDDYNRLN
jgi:mannose-6-phosphate isomerase-like protein (cupin superfamily)